MVFHVACYIQAESYCCQVEQLYEQGQTIGTRNEASPVIGNLSKSFWLCLSVQDGPRMKAFRKIPEENQLIVRSPQAGKDITLLNLVRDNRTTRKSVATYDCSKILPQPWTLQVSPIVSTEQDRVNKVR